MAQSAVRRLSTPRLFSRGRTFYLLLFTCVLAACDPGKYTLTPSSPLPPSNPAATSNAYIGTQSPLNWTLAIDDTQHAYSYQSHPIDGSTPISSSGNFVQQGGFLNMGSGGLAIELPGTSAILRPGDNTTAPVVMVHQENCFPLSGNLRYLLDGMVPTNSGSYPSPQFYQRGDVVASTSPDGKAWSFENAEYFDFTGSPLTLTYKNQYTPTTFSGDCSLINGAAAVSINTSGTYTLPTTFHFSASGMAVVDYTHTGSAVGFAQPVNPMDTKSLAGANFVGFQVEYSSTTPVLTQPVSFGPAVDGSVGLSGGIFANDDVTQTADVSSLFKFGSQSSLINGLFTGATMVVIDPQGGCATNGVGTGDLGVNSNGVPTCRLHLSTVVGQINGEAVLVMSGLDFRTSNPVSSVQFYLVQQ